MQGKWASGQGTKAAAITRVTDISLATPAFRHMEGFRGQICTLVVLGT